MFFLWKILLSGNWPLDCIDSLTLEDCTHKVADIGSKASNITIYFSFQVLQVGLTQLLQVGLTQVLQVGLTQVLQMGLTQVLQVGLTQVLQVGLTQVLQQGVHLPVNQVGWGTKQHLCSLPGGHLLELSRLQLHPHPIHRPSFMDKTSKLA